MNAGRVIGVGPFSYIEGSGAEQVVYCSDHDTGLRAIIAVHSTALGPALGGTRFLAYENEHDALVDVLRLARGMTYKAAAAGLDLGGGKAVIIGNPATDKTPELLRAYGRHVESLGGRFVTAEDVGTCVPDMEIVRTVTRHVVGVGERLGGRGDPSPVTARGVRAAMRAVALELWGTADLANRRVVVSGVGKVGSSLARLLAQDGAIVVVADVVPAAVARLTGELGLEAVPVEVAHRVPCDIFAPCALGGVIDERTAPELACSAVVGSANNQLAEPALAKVLDDTGVLYAPDYIANAGGLITVAGELNGDPPGRAGDAVERIFDTMRSVIEAAKDEHITTLEAAERLAERRLARHAPSLGLH
jgi:leucine dehydrogenase